MRALVIEDDDAIANLNRRLLEQEGFDVEVASTIGEGTRLVRAGRHELIMLDMVLPDGNGIDVLPVIRENGRTTPVLIVSGSGDIRTTVDALDAGADDYLNKPYDADELRARVRALIRRSQSAEPARLVCGNVTLDRTTRFAAVAGERLNLTAKEFSLLEYFVVNEGRTIPRKDLLEHVWRFSFDPGTNMIDVSVSRLRAKLNAVGASCLLESQRGLGYVFHKN